MARGQHKPWCIAKVPDLKPTQEVRRIRCLDCEDADEAEIRGHAFDWWLTVDRMRPYRCGRYWVWIVNNHGVA